MNQSPDIRRAQISDRALAAAVRAADGGLVPAVSLRVSPQQRYGLGFDQTTGQAVGGRVETMSLGASASLPLYDGGQARARARRAEFERAAAAADLDRARDLLTIEVVERFLQLVLDREFVTIQRGQLAGATATLEKVEGLVEAGVRPPSDRATQLAIVAERQTGLLEAEGAVVLDRLVLAQTVGLDPNSAYTFVGPDVEALARSEPPAAAEFTPELIRSAQAARSDRAALELGVDAARASVAAARAASQPRLELSASFNTGYSSLQQRLANPGAPPLVQPVTLGDGTPVFIGDAPLTFPVGTQDRERTPLLRQLTSNGSGAIGVSLTIPLSDRYASQRGVIEAEVSVASQLLAIEALDRQIATEIGRAVVLKELAQGRVVSTTAQVEAAAEALRAVERRYRVGSGTLYDIEQAQSRLAAAEIGWTQALYEVVFRAILLRLAAGSLDPDHIATSLGGVP